MPPGHDIESDAGPLSPLNHVFDPYRVEEDGERFRHALAKSNDATLRERAGELDLFAGVDPEVAGRYLAWFDQTAIWTDDAVSSLLKLLRHAVKGRHPVTFVFLTRSTDGPDVHPVSVELADFPLDPMHVVISGEHAA